VIVVFYEKSNEKISAGEKEIPGMFGEV